jgi:hypothetical protein
MIQEHLLQLVLVVVVVEVAAASLAGAVVTADKLIMEVILVMGIMAVTVVIWNDVNVK